MINLWNQNKNVILYIFEWLHRHQFYSLISCNFEYEDTVFVTEKKSWNFFFLENLFGKRNKNHNNWKYPLNIYHNFVEQNIIFCLLPRQEFFLKIKSFSRTLGKEKSIFISLLLHWSLKYVLFAMTISERSTKIYFFCTSLYLNGSIFFLYQTIVTLMEDFIILNIMEMNIYSFFMS